MKATACSRFLVNLENFQTRISWKGESALLASSSILRNWGLSAILPLSASSMYSPGYDVAVLVGVIPERPELGGHGEVHVLAVAGYPGVEGRRYWVVAFTH